MRPSDENLKIEIYAGVGTLSQAEWRRQSPKRPMGHGVTGGDIEFNGQEQEAWASVSSCVGRCIWGKCSG